MKRFVFAVALVAVALTLGSCASPVRQPTYLGTLEVDGESASLNGRRASTGQRVDSGDRLATGRGTSVRLVLRTGGYIQLDESTDPVFEWLEKFGCLLVRDIIGQVLVATEGVCVRTGGTEGRTTGSTVNVYARGAQVVVTVIDGSFEVARPTPVTLRQYQQYVVTSGIATRPVQLTPEQALATAKWAEPYFRGRTLPPAGWCCVQGKLSESSAIACKERRGEFFTSHDVASQRCTPSTKPTKREIDRTIEAGNSLVAILNQVNNSLNDVGSSLDNSRYADARRSLDDAAKKYESSNVPFETLKQYSGHEAFRAIYNLAAQMRDLQSRLLGLSKRALSQATGNDRKGYQESVTAGNKLINAYNAKVREFNEKLRGLAK